jgi:methyl-accepting chemotaxis protein
VGRIKAASDHLVALSTANEQLAFLDMKESDVQIAQRNMLLATSDPARAAANAKLDTIKQAATDAWNEFSRLSLQPSEQTALEGLRSQYATYLDEVTAQMPVLAPIDPSSPKAAVALNREQVRAATMQARINSVRGLLTTDRATAQQDVQTTIQTIRLTVLLTGGIAMVLLTLVSTLTARSITGPLRKVVEALKAVAGKDLTVTIDVDARMRSGRWPQPSGKHWLASARPSRPWPTAPEPSHPPPKSCPQCPPSWAMPPRRHPPRPA